MTRLRPEGYAGQAPDKETANKLFIGSGEFLRACAEADQFPPAKLPEVAFIGRSNVGKSSLINALTARKALARSSKTPGRTQQIIFFDIKKTLTLADLPGYGHAKAPRAEQDHWNQLIHDYLRARPQLLCVCLLIDGRHGAKKNDLSMMAFLDRAGVAYQVVLTKIDDVKKVDLPDILDSVQTELAKHPAARSNILAVSSETKQGIDDLRQMILTLVRQFGS